MFERYTESARRAVFYARYEASFGTDREISTSDLLRGIVRESKQPTQEIEWIQVNRGRLCETLWPAESERKIARFLKEEIKLSNDAKRALAYAAEESAKTPLGTIDAPTLLLGILAFKNESSAKLEQLGLTLESARENVRNLHEKYPPKPMSWISLIKGELRGSRKRLLQILIFLLWIFGAVALVNWINR